MPRLTASGGISREMFKRGSQNFTRLSVTIGPTCLPDMTLLAVSGRLQNVIKYSTEVCKTRPPGKSRMIRPLFNLESQNFAQTSMPT